MERSNSEIVVSISADFCGLAGVWPKTSELGQTVAYAFQARDVLEAWIATIGKSRGTVPILVRVDSPSGLPLMLVPLGMERRRGARVLTFLDGGVSDYNAPILFPGSEAIDVRDMAKIWRIICEAIPSVDAIVLEKMPGHIGDTSNPFPLIFRKPEAYSGHSLALTDTWEDFLRTRLPRGQDSRRKRRHLNEIGDLQFKIARN